MEATAATLDSEQLTLDGFAPTVPAAPVRLFHRNGRTIRGTVNHHRRCDDRCTHAVGDECSCQCGGVNHGIYSGRVILAAAADLTLLGVAL